MWITLNFSGYYGVNSKEEYQNGHVLISRNIKQSNLILYFNKTITEKF